MTNISSFVTLFCYAAFLRRGNVRGEEVGCSASDSAMQCSLRDADQSEQRWVSAPLPEQDLLIQILQDLS